MEVPLGRIVNVGEAVIFQGTESVVVSFIENDVGTDDLLTLSDGRTCWASDLDLCCCPSPWEVEAEEIG